MAGADSRTAVRSAEADSNSAAARTRSCCAFAASKEFVTSMPNTYAALLKSIIEATAFAHKPENRKQIAEAIAPANYINAPVTVLEQVLTGTYADGLGNVSTATPPSTAKLRSSPRTTTTSRTPSSA